MLSVAVAAMPCMEEKTLVMEKALARSTRKVSELVRRAGKPQRPQRSILHHRPIVFYVPVPMSFGLSIGGRGRPRSLSMPPSLSPSLPPLRIYPFCSPPPSLPPSRSFHPSFGRLSRDFARGPSAHFDIGAPPRTRREAGRKTNAARS